MKDLAQPLISIIVPVYNADRYLRECIESILNQSYENFQLILIDDGSTDASADICDEYASVNQKITVIHQENSGVTSARKRGLQYSLGTYICFCDADDYMYQNSLQMLLDAFDDDIDIVIANAGRDRVLACEEYVNDLLKNVLPWGPWAKMFKRRLFKDDTLNIPRYFNIGEDLLMQLKVAPNIKGRIKCVSQDVYALRSNPYSVTQNRTYSKEYESRFISEILSYTSSFPFDVSASIFRIRINSLKLLIQKGVSISYDDEWVKNIMQDSKEYPTTLTDKIVLKIHCTKISKYLLLFKNIIW